MKQIKSDVILIQFHFIDRRFEFIPLLLNHLLSFFNLLFLFLKLLYLLIYLLFHHLEEILMLDFKLVHNSPEAFLKLINLFIEFLSNFHFQLIVEFFIDHDGLVLLINFKDHFFYHLFHFINFWRNLDDLVLQLSMLQYTFGAEHIPTILTIKFNFLRGMYITESNWFLSLVFLITILTICSWWLNSHWKSSKHRIINW